MDIGLERAGMTCRWQVEIDPFCQKVLAKHWPEVPKYGDITKLDGNELERVDLICGGFPCQDLSVAGNMGGIDGSRTGLWAHYARLLGVLRPGLVLIENVPGLLANEPMRRVLGDLSSLGYDAEWSVLSACALGATHTRERLFLVAHANRPGSFRWRIGEGGTGRNQASDCCDRHLQSAFWTCDPDPLCRVADGLSRGLDKGKRLKVLGNAVVPQVAEVIGRLILASEWKEQ